jgi:hypothetical protein
MITTYINGAYVGERTMKDISRIRADKCRRACNEQRAAQADHMVYARYIYNADGNVTTAHFYTPTPMTDAEFDDYLSNILESSHVYALHRKE